MFQEGELPPLVAIQRTREKFGSKFTLSNLFEFRAYWRQDDIARAYRDFSDPRRTDAVAEQDLRRYADYLKSTRRAGHWVLKPHLRSSSHALLDEEFEAKKAAEEAAAAATAATPATTDAAAETAAGTAAVGGAPAVPAPTDAKTGGGK